MNNEPLTTADRHASAVGDDCVRDEIVCAVQEIRTEYDDADARERIESSVDAVDEMLADHGDRLTRAEHREFEAWADRTERNARWSAGEREAARVTASFGGPVPEWL